MLKLFMILFAKKAKVLEFLKRFVIFFLLFIIFSSAGFFVYLNKKYIPAVLMYHYVKDSSIVEHDKRYIRPQTFDKQMKFLKDRKYNVIPLEKFAASLKEKKPCNIIFRLPTTDHIDRHLGYNGYKILKEFDGIVVLNHHDLNMLESFCEHVYFIPNVIIPFRGVTTEEKDESIFITSRVTKTKNIKLLLEITKILSNYTFLIQISKNFNDCLFYYQTLVSLKKRKNVYIVRQSLDNSCWFGRCKYYVSTSISDGLSNSIIEALFNNNLVFCLPTVSNRYFSTCVYFYENASQLRHLFLMQKNGTLESENKQKAAQKLLVQHQKNYIAERWNIFLSLIS